MIEVKGLANVKGFAEKLQSDKWAAALACKTAESSNPVDVQRMLDQLQIDYPHVFIKLTNNGHVIGSRRVFGDRSFADMYFGGTVIETGVMTEGVLGEAQNGRVITALH